MGGKEVRLTAGVPHSPPEVGAEWNLASSDPLILWQHGKRCLHPRLNKIQLSLTHLVGSKRGVPFSPFATSSLGYLYRSSANSVPILFGMFLCKGCDLPQKGTTTLRFSPLVTGTCDQWFLPVLSLPENGSGGTRA